MNQLKLRGYFIENFKGSFPPFPKQKQGEKVKEEFSVITSLYKNKKSKGKNKNNFALKILVKSIAKNVDTNKPRIHFEVTMFGLFRRLDEQIPIRLLAKTTAKNMLYEKVYSIFSNVLNNSPVENFKIPLKLKQSR